MARCLRVTSSLLAAAAGVAPPAVAPQIPSSVSFATARASAAASNAPAKAALAGLSGQVGGGAPLPAKATALAQAWTPKRSHIRSAVDLEAPLNSLLPPMTQEAQDDPTTVSFGAFLLAGVAVTLAIGAAATAGRYRRRQLTASSPAALELGMGGALWANPARLAAAAMTGEAATEGRTASRVCRRATSATSLLDALAQTGPVGVDTTEEQQAQVEKMACELDGNGDDEAQARVPLKGTYDLLYSMAPGGSNGKVGPFVGAVSQIITDETNFINQVSLFNGAVVVQLYAKREIIGDNQIRVEFVETVFKIFGMEVKRQQTQGKGVWKQLYVERAPDGSAALRVMRTPSLFVLRQRAS